MPPQEPQTDPWEEAAKKFKAQPQGQSSPSQPPNEDWKIWQGQGSTPNYGPGVTVVNPTLSQVGMGALREGANLLSGGYSFGRKALEMVPGVKDSGLGHAMESHQATLDQMAQPQNTGEAMGRTGTEMLSYLAPAKLESDALKGAEALPGLVRPLARVAIPAASNAAMSGMNRQSPVTGGAIGAGAGVLGETGRMIANPLVRSAIPGNVGKDTAAAVLEHTRGIRPTTVLRGTEAGIDTAGRNLDAAVSAATERNAPHIRGFLMPPVQETPLGGTNEWLPKRAINDVPGELIPAARLPQGNILGEGTDMSTSGPGGRTRGVIGRQVEQMGSTSHTVPPRMMREAYITQGIHEPQDFTRAGVGPGGIWARRPEMSASIPPTREPNRIISTQPAQQPIERAMSVATRQRVPGDVDQLQEQLDFLRGAGKYGPERPQILTPYEALDARRGFGKNFVSNRQWKQVANSEPLAAAKAGYGGLTSELHAKVPGSVEADEMMHNLIPARTGLRTLVRNDPSVVGNVAGRVGARTGALTSTAMGAAGGLRSGGLPGAIAGGGAGLIIPEVMSTPTAKMAMARSLYSRIPPRLARAVMTPGMQSVVNSLRQQRTGGQ